MAEKTDSQILWQKFIFLLGSVLVVSGLLVFTLVTWRAPSVMGEVGLALLLTLGTAFWIVRRYASGLVRQFVALNSRRAAMLKRVKGVAWEADAESGDFIFVSQQAEQLLGCPLKAWYEPGFWKKHLHPDDLAALPVLPAGDLSGLQDSYEADFRFVAHDGRIVWLHNQWSFTVEPGRPTQLFGLMLDITERRQQEELTRQALMERDTILHNALVGIAHLKHRRIVSCNRRFEELFRYAPGELTDCSTELLYDTRETFVLIGEQAYGTLQHEASFSGEAMFRHKNGSLFYGALTGCAIDPSQPHEGSIWVFADVSERHAAEREVHKLLQAIEQSPVSIVITSREGLIEYVNPRFSKVSGYSRQEVIGQNPRILQSGETPPETYQELWKTLLDGQEWRGVVRNRRKDGELFWEEASISPIIDDKGEIINFLAVKEDITERVRVHQELVDHQLHLDEMVRQRTTELSEALEAAKLADRAKDQFLAIVSHELRTPLNAVIGMADLARRLSRDPLQQDYLDKVGNAGKTLAHLINDLLDLSKIVAGRMEFEHITFSLCQVIVRINSVMAVRASEKGLQLVEALDVALPDTLVGDPLRIEQIMLNLLGNAIKFTHAGQIAIRIGEQAREASRICLFIEIEDSGVGISEDDIGHLFKPFSQADASMSRKFGGTGLGLAICKNLAELMGGEISVSSRLGQGSTFRVTLWLGLGNAENLPEAELVGDDFSALRYRDVRVLVVEDQALNQEIAEALLKIVGIVPRMVDNGQEALDLFDPRDEAAAESFDLILMDIQMPIMDGLTATRALRRRKGFESLPIIAMTAHTMAHEKEISLAAGMNDHIGKPFDNAVFYRTLAQWLPEAKRQPPCLAESAAVLSVDVIGPTGGLTALSSIDTRSGIGRFGGDEKRYRHWLDNFVDEGPAVVVQIRQWLATGNIEAARQVAHAFKGRVGMLGMMGLHGVASTLEAALKQGEAPEPWLGRLAQGIAQTADEIASIGRQPPNGGSRSTPLADAEALPAEPLPAAIEHLFSLLAASDGNSATALARCLDELKETPWAPYLQRALASVQNFDFAAARQALSRSTGCELDQR